VSFGEKLKAMRKAAGMTQAGLAEASGVPIGTIRDYEQLKREPLLLTAAKIARALSVRLEEFTVGAWERRNASAARKKGKPGLRK
jgi:transcriptional regulator with XRE-family HTH domain